VLARKHGAERTEIVLRHRGRNKNKCLRCVGRCYSINWLFTLSVVHTQLCLNLLVAHFVVTLVSAIVRKLALKEAERFGSNESAYLTCLCVARAQIPPIFLKLAGYCARLHRFILQHSSQKVRIRMSCSKRCKANYLWEPQRVCVCVRALLCARYNTHAILDPAPRRSEASLQRTRCRAETAPRVI
jgi:hypothetical protein